MALAKLALKQLQSYCKKQHQSAQGKSDKWVFDQAIDDFRIQVKVTDFDRFSFVMESLFVEKLTGEAGARTLIKKQAEFLKSKLTYLLENIEIFEIDEVNSKAQLRSDKPETEQTSLSYYEIVIDGGARITLHRVLFDKLKREKSSTQFHLTNEVIEKAMNDFVMALQMNP
ncbi:MAG: hypothetical protein ACE5G1_03765 [bacterium]